MSQNLNKAYPHGVDQQYSNSLGSFPEPANTIVSQQSSSVAMMQ